MFAEQDDYPLDVRLRVLLSEAEPHLYRENAEFHAAVDTLAAMLPHMVAGLATECAKKQRTALEEYARRMREPMSWTTSPHILEYLS